MKLDIQATDITALEANNTEAPALFDPYRDIPEQFWKAVEAQLIESHSHDNMATLLESGSAMKLLRPDLLPRFFVNDPSLRRKSATFVARHVDFMRDKLYIPMKALFGLSPLNLGFDLPKAKLIETLISNNHFAQAIEIARNIKISNPTFNIHTELSNSAIDALLAFALEGRNGNSISHLSARAIELRLISPLLFAQLHITDEEKRYAIDLLSSSSNFTNPNDIISILNVMLLCAEDVIIDEDGIRILNGGDVIESPLPQPKDLMY